MGWKRLAFLAATISLLASMLLPGISATALGSDTLVSVGSPPSPFAQNKQNEPSIAIDAHDTTGLAAGSNDEIDLEACNAGDPTSCPFTAGVGLSGIYFSFDSGQTWTQPTYTGWSARHCLGPAPCDPHVGPIGTLPKYFENGLVSGGDPSLAFGPRPGQNGFTWDNGSRLYYANLAANFSSERSEQHFKGFEAIAVSRTDDPQAAAAGNADAWMEPVIASKQNSALFADHEQIWADNAESSPYFGNVYVCYAAFRSQERGNALPNPITVARSSDGGDTWRTTQISDASNNPTHGQQDCWVRTDSGGVVYVFWQAIKANTGRAIYMARSFTGGQTFDKFRIVSSYAPTGLIDPVSGDRTFDGVAGARDGTFPTADVANGAPTGAEATDRPNFPAIAISPDGTDVYLTYNGFHVPWQSTTANPRPMNSVLRHATTDAAGAPVGWTTVFEGPTGDARGSSANALSGEFLGDYNYAAATRDYGIGI